jgi:hypothetical protein
VRRQFVRKVGNIEVVETIVEEGMKAKERERDDQAEAIAMKEGGKEKRNQTQKRKEVEHQKEKEDHLNLLMIERRKEVLVEEKIAVKEVARGINQNRLQYPEPVREVVLDIGIKGLGKRPNITEAAILEMTKILASNLEALTKNRAVLKI